MLRRLFKNTVCTLSTTEQQSKHLRNLCQVSYPDGLYDDLGRIDSVVSFVVNIQ